MIGWAVVLVAIFGLGLFVQMGAKRFLQRLFDAVASRVPFCRQHLWNIKTTGRDYNVVIIPTAPVPFGGALVFMPVECVQPADMSVDGLMSIYVSMGITAPQFLNDQGKHPRSS